MTRTLLKTIFLVVALTTLPAVSSAEEKSAQGVCAPAFTTPAEVAAASLVIFGERHGTNEAPALVYQFVCQMVMSGKSAGVALEIPSREQPLIDAYLASDGTHADRLALLRGSFWQSNFQDGRASTAMANLMENLRRLNAETNAVRVVAMDGGLPGMKRDESMARTLEATMGRSASDKWVALVGNVHAAKVSLFQSNPDYRSFAYHLAAVKPYSVSIEFRSGTAWNCMAVCGVSALSNQSDVGPNGFQLGVARFAGFDAAFRLTLATASQPAVGQVTAD